MNLSKYLKRLIIILKTSGVEVRLINARRSEAHGGYVEGYVEVWHHGEWGSICDDRFDNRDAKVVCGVLQNI